MEQLLLKIPARAQYLHLLRAVISSVAARMNLTFDELDDLQIAADEAGSFMLAAKLDSPPDYLNVGAAQGSVSAEMWMEGNTKQWPPDGATKGLAWTVITALTNDAEFHRREGWPAISFSKTVRGDEANDG